MTYGLKKHHLEKIINIIAQNQNVEKIILFGSRAIGNFKPSSDIDIALIGTNLKLNDLLELSSKIDDLNLPYKADLIIYNWIKEALLKEHINRIGISLWSKNSL